MTDAQTPATSATTTVETSAGKEAGGTVTFEKDGSQTVHQQADGKQSVEVGEQLQPVDGTKDTPAAGDVKDGAEPKPEAKPDDQAIKADAPLPAFKADDEAVVKQYDGRYTTEEGKAINMANLSADWWASVKDGKLEDGKLPDGAYDYLQHRFGLTKDDVKDIERGRVADIRSQQAALVTRAGGVDQLGAALKWGREGGYTKDQLAAYNAAAGGSDREKANDAVDLLMARFEKSKRASANPKVTTATGAATSGGKGQSNVYGSKADWLADRKAAGNDMTKQQAVSNKFRRSPGASGW